MQDGTTRSLETVIDERKKLEFKYEEAVASGKTAVFGTLTKQQKDMVRISLGNFPSHSQAILKVHYFQLLPVEDLSYSLRIPVTYVPRYAGDLRKFIENGAPYKGMRQQILQPDQKLQNLIDWENDQLHSIPLVAGEAPYLWNLRVRVQVQGSIERLCCRSHLVSHQLSPDAKSALVTLKDVDLNQRPAKDFHLLIRDAKVNVPVAYGAVNEHQEQAIMLDMLADVTPPRLKAQFLAQPDFDPSRFYDVMRLE